MAEKQPQKATQKIIKKKKKWFIIVAPKEFNNVVLGETPAYEPENLMGRSIIVNLMTLVRDPKKQSYNVTFKVIEVRNNEAHTMCIRYELPTVNIKRLIKKAKEKVDDAFMIETKDNVKAMIKPLFVTKAMTQHSKLTFLRKRTQEFLSRVAKDKTFSELISMLVTTELQRSLRSELKKIYPLSVCEIRMLERR